MPLPCMLRTSLGCPACSGFHSNAHSGENGLPCWKCEATSSVADGKRPPHTALGPRVAATFGRVRVFLHSLASLAKKFIVPKATTTISRPSSCWVTEKFPVQSRVKDSGLCPRLKASNNKFMRWASYQDCQFEQFCHLRILQDLHRFLAGSRVSVPLERCVEKFAERGKLDCGRGHNSVAWCSLLVH